MQHHHSPGLLRVPLGNGETANSFASRLAARNGTARLLEFCTDLGLSLEPLARGEPDTLRALARITGVDAARLLRHKPQMVERNRYRFGVESIRGRAIQRVRLRFCPICLADDARQDSEYGPYQRSRWLLTSVRTCHAHRCV